VTVAAAVVLRVGAAEADPGVGVAMPTAAVATVLAAVLAVPGVAPSVVEDPPLHPTRISSAAADHHSRLMTSSPSLAGKLLI